MSRTAGDTAGNSPVQKMLSYRWIIFGVLATGYLLTLFHRLSPAVMAEDLRATFAIDAAALGLLGSMYFYPYALMQLPAGVLADTVGPRRLATASLALAGTGALLFAAAPNFQILLVARLLIGLGLSCLYVPTLKIFATWFRPNEFATIAGMLISIGNVGGLAAATPLALLLLAIGWRWSVRAIGIVSLVTAAIIYLVVRDSPKEIGCPTLDQIDGVPAKEHTAAERIPVWQGIKMVLGNRYFWPMAVRSFTSYGVLMAFQSLWGGPYLMQVHGLSKIQAGNILMMLALGAIFTPPIGGYLSDKVFRSRKGITIVAAFLSTLGYIPLAFMTGTITPAFLYVWLFLLGACGGLGVAGLAMVKELFPPSLTGTVNGINNLFVMSGGALYQVIVGMIISRYGETATGYPVEAYAAAFRFLFFSMVVGTIALFFAKETMGKKTKAAA